MVSRKVFAGNLRAERRTRKVGSGIEFADHRTYARGDDFRYIDWNLYGRLDKLLLRLFEEEEDLHIYILVDCLATRWRSASRCRSCTTRCRSARRSPTSGSRTSIASRSSRSRDRLHRPAAAVARQEPDLPRVRVPAQRASIGGKTELAECMKDVRHAEQAARPRGRDLATSTIPTASSRASTRSATQVRAVRAPGLRPARGRRRSCTAISRSSTARPATLARSRCRSRCSRPTRREHEKYCKELEAYCTKYAMPFFRTHTAIPFDELVLKIFRSGGFLR